MQECRTDLHGMMGAATRPGGDDMAIRPTLSATPPLLPGRDC